MARPRKQTDETALFVRIPSAEAAKLHRAADALGAPKRELITRLVAQYVDPDDPTMLSALGGTRAEWRSASTVLPGLGNGDPDPGAAAGLLQVEEEVVVELAEKQELPGRKVGEEWRFARGDPRVARRRGMRIGRLERAWAAAALRPAVGWKVWRVAEGRRGARLRRPVAGGRTDPRERLPASARGAVAVLRVRHPCGPRARRVGALPARRRRVARLRARATMGRDGQGTRAGAPPARGRSRFSCPPRSPSRTRGCRRTVSRCTCSSRSRRRCRRDPARADGGRADLARRALVRHLLATAQGPDRDGRLRDRRPGGEPRRRAAPAPGVRRPRQGHLGLRELAGRRRLRGPRDLRHDDLRQARHPHDLRRDGDVDGLRAARQEGARRASAARCRTRRS